MNSIQTDYTVSMQTLLIARVIVKLLNEQKGFLKHLYVTISISGYMSVTEAFSNIDAYVNMLYTSILFKPSEP